VSRGLRSLIKRIERIADDGDPDTVTELEKRAQTISRILRQASFILVWSVTIMLVLAELGVDLKPILAGAGILGLAIGFGAQTLVKDVITGFFILLENQIRVGDVVTAAGFTGEVEAVNLRTTVLRDVDGKTHIIPNSAITVVTNATRDFSRALLDVGVSYREDTDRALMVMRQVGSAMEKDPVFGRKIMGSFEYPGVQALGESSILLRIGGEDPRARRPGRAARAAPAREEGVRRGEDRDPLSALEGGDRQVKRGLTPFLLLALAACRAPRHKQATDDDLAARIVPVLTEAIRFETVQGNTEARDAQQRWLLDTAKRMGFQARDTGKMVEIDLPATSNAPVLGLVVHGDVQPASAEGWSFPPFEGTAKDGYVYGRGSCDDKGPLVQALFAMDALRASKKPRTHTVRLLVGSDEESDNKDVTEYLKEHRAPDLSLVLDYVFPVIVGEMAWTGLDVDTKPGPRGATDLPYQVQSLRAGLSPSIVPDRATLTLKWSRGGVANWAPVKSRFEARRLPEGTRLKVAASEDDPSILIIDAFGKAAHGGVNLQGGRNALVALARASENLLPRSGEDDLLAFARLAGKDLHGTGLGLTENDPIWGRYLVNVATVKARDDGSLRLSIVFRRPPPRTGPQMKAYLTAKVRAFERATGASFKIDGYWQDEPYVVDPESKLVKRLLAAYERGTGEKARPGVAGGATYAHRLPNAVAFGMWFPGKPYAGHDVDERIPIADLVRGTQILIAALEDLACGAPIKQPLDR
jgi:predicted dipeptidase